MGIETAMNVAATTDARNLADSIRVGFTDGAHCVELIAIGSGAVNQAVKAVAIVRRHHKLSVVVVPTFMDIEHPEKGTITGMCLQVTVDKSA